MNTIFQIYFIPSYLCERGASEEVNFVLAFNFNHDAEEVLIETHHKLNSEKQFLNEGRFQQGPIMLWVNSTSSRKKTTTT